MSFGAFAVILCGMLVVGMGSYVFGWWWRGRFERSRVEQHKDIGGGE